MHTYDEWLDDLTAVPKDERKTFIRASLREKHMLPVFGRYFFPEQIPEGSETPECQYQLAEELANEKNSAIIMPRGHGKTSWTRIDLIHDIVYHHEDFIVLVAPTLTDAQMSFSFVKSQLESNNLLVDIYTDLVPEFSFKKKRKWSDSHFETTNSVICIARGQGKGRGLNIGGKRPTKIIIDDMEDKEAVKQEKQRKKMEDWLFQTLLPALDKDKGKAKMIGTVLHYACILLKFHEKFGGMKRAAIEKDGKPSMDGEPIWWTREQLDKERHDIGSFAFAQEFMNDPKSDENSDVKLKWIQRVGDVKLFDKNDRPLFKFFSALDPAVGTKEKHDEAALVTVAKRIDSENLDLIVLNVEHGRWGLTGTVTEAQRVFDRYPHEKFGVEAVAFQETFRQALSQSGVAASPIHPVKDKRSRLQSIVGLIEFGNIKFAPHTEDLITQLIEFPNGEHDDMVDAFVYAILLAKGSGKGVIFQTF